MAGEHRSERATYPDRPEEVGLQLGADVGQRRVEDGRAQRDARVAHDDRDVGRRLRGGGDRRVVGDVDDERDDPLVALRLRRARRRVHLRGAAREQLVDERAAEPAVATGDEGGGPLDGRA